MQSAQGPFNMPQYKAAFKADFSAFAVKFNPFQQDLLALGCAENFGFVGKGSLFILKLVNDGTMKPLGIFPEPEAVFDCSWNEESENLIAISSGQGIIKLIDTATQKAIHTLKNHEKEVYTIEFSHKIPPLCLSAGFDGIINLTDFVKGSKVNQFAKHQGCVYQATWHPSNEKLFASCAMDGVLKLWDISSPKASIAAVPAHQEEILSCDFNKYVEHIATASIDKKIKIWDLRKLDAPVKELIGHRHPVRKVKFSPHENSIVGSASYDMNVNIWDLNDAAAPLKFVHQQHTEFAIGLDFNLYNKRQIASCAWDGRALVWNWDQDQPKI